MNILITGGAGFIGGNFLRCLREWAPNASITNLDKLSYASTTESTQDLAQAMDYRFVQGDICDAKLINRLMQQTHFDLLFHFAAESHVDRSIENASEFANTNVVGTQMLLHAAMTHKVGRFVNISTDEVYGALSLDATELFTEESQIEPNSPYSAAKAGADLIARAYHITFGLDVVTTRCSNNYGPWQYPEKLIPTMILAALADKPLPVYGDGLYVRDWIHVEDHCRAIWNVGQNGVKGEVYNVGADHEVANIDLVKNILSMLDKPESLIAYGKDRPGHDRRYAIDSSKIHNTLHWQPKQDFTSGFEATIKWYCDNQDWCARMLEQGGRPARDA